MDFEFPEDTLMLRDMLRRFIQKEARPLEMDYFNSGLLKPEQRAKLRRSIEQLGLWGYQAPEKYGGAGLDLVTSCVIEEELGGTFIPLEMGNVAPILYACQGDQVGKFLEPALEGSRRPIFAAREPGRDGVRPEGWSTTAVYEGDTFHINGQKVLSALPSQNDFLIVFTKSVFPTVTAFLLEPDAPGIRFPSLAPHPPSPVLLMLENCQAGRESLLGEEGGALRLSADEAPHAWILMGARYVGMVERLLEMAAEHARDWVSLGAALAVRPAIQRMLAEMRVDADSVRWLVYHAAWQTDTHAGKAGKERPNTASIDRVQAAQVRLASGEMLKRAVDRVTMIYTGPSPSMPIEPQRLVQSAIPMEALELALEYARAVIAEPMLHSSQA